MKTRPGPDVVDGIYDILEKYSKDSDGKWLAGDRIRSNIVTELIGLIWPATTGSPQPSDPGEPK